ncbi:MAG: hypothetical protein ABDK94_04590 [Atribacterota bacterium]
MQKFFLLILFFVVILAGCNHNNFVTTGQDSPPQASPITQVPGHQDFIK